MLSDEGARGSGHRGRVRSRENRDRNDGRQSEVTSDPSDVSAPGGCRHCAGCGAVITDRFLLQAVSKYWHEECLRCGACACRLGEVGSSLYEKADLILCRRDYLRLFGSSGHCTACSKPIPAFEMVMRARENVYHLECFACRRCNQRFCVGDRYYLHDGQVLCELDYEERRNLPLVAQLPAISSKRGGASEPDGTRHSQTAPSNGTSHQHPCSVR
ncbi:LIM domain only protein 3-like isoform X2 [Amphibalanus amphitrite]|uniref:LIM domain only protein 3-like isoform X2 n=1 Tax=Amphibalanus amphitrite TaxID=1232801 RepID=UPI001C921BCF|nr:LIM domain only protein 3-like isoform X2 [Amphibalanus amphitrite]